MSFDDKQPPWGKKKGPTSPEDFIASLLKKVKESFENKGGQGGGGGKDTGSSQGGTPPDFGASIMKVVTIAAILFLVQVVYSSFYTIDAGENGVVMRFGKFYKLAEAGLNFKAPLIDEVIKVDVETVRTQEFGFRTRSPGQKTIYAKRGYELESLMLTGDKNVIDVQWIVQYKVQDPFHFVFKVRNVDQSVRDLSETAMRQVVGNQDFDYVLTNREILEAETTLELQSTLNRYQSGVKILAVKLQDVNPPNSVKPAFNEVNEADQDMKRLVNEAEQIYNRVIPKARGDAKKLLQEAQGYSIERINLAKGETSRFLSVLGEYKKAKEVTRKRLYLETMQQVLPKVEDIYVVDSEQKSILPLLNLSSKQQSITNKVK